jgi:hypothetical protein
MRSISRFLALGALVTMAAGPASADWRYKGAAPFFQGSSETSAPGIVKNDPISLAPNRSVAEVRTFRPFDTGPRAYAVRLRTVKPFVPSPERSSTTETTTRGR